MDLLQKHIEIGEEAMANGNYEKASEIFLKLTKSELSSFYAYFCLAKIANFTNDPLTAKGLYYKAFEIKPDLCSLVFAQNHPNFGYVFKGMLEEPKQEVCPLCGKPGEPYWCYCLLENFAAYVQSFNPVRLWMHCRGCRHLYSEEFPVQKFEPSKDPGKLKGKGMPTMTQMLSGYSLLLSKLGSFTQGNELLEIGVGRL